MFDNTNPYTLRVEIIERINHYYVCFRDGQAIPRETEVSRPVYLEFLRFVKSERNLRRSDERHIEQSQLTDETLNARASCLPKSVEETMLNDQRDEQLRQAVAELPEIQRRRFILYHELGLAYAQIAKMEGCKKQSICDSVLLAEKKVREKLKNLED